MPPTQRCGSGTLIESLYGLSVLKSRIFAALSDSFRCTFVASLFRPPLPLHIKLFRVGWFGGVEYLYPVLDILCGGSEDGSRLWPPR